MLDSELWPVVNAACYAQHFLAETLFDSNPDLDPVTSGHVRRSFDLLLSDYSAGRDLEEIRGEFEKLVKDWAPPEVDAKIRGLEVGVWLRAFGLESYMQPWLAVLKPSSTTTITHWILGDADALDRPDRPKTRPVVVEANDLARRSLLEADDIAAGLESYVRQRWYRGSRWQGWWNIHNDEDLLEIGNYLGYWCWEAAAIVLMTGVDDSHLRDAKYYPYDLVHYLDD